MNKICAKCKVEKNIGEFYVDRTHRDGHTSFCKLCKKRVNNNWRFNNKEKKSSIDALYREKNRLILREKQKKSYIRDKEKIDNRNKRWQISNKDKKRKSDKSWRYNNRDKLNIQKKEKLKNDIHFKLKHNISNLIRQKLKRHLFNKGGKSTFTFLPYTVDELREYLESLWEPWMNWRNYGWGKGKWVIDHIKPDSSFNYKSVDDREFQECWALKNLRPLEFIENSIKGDKII